MESLFERIENVDAEDKRDVSMLGPRLEVSDELLNQPIYDNSSYDVLIVRHIIKEILSNPGLIAQLNFTSQTQRDFFENNELEQIVTGIKERLGFHNTGDYHIDLLLFATNSDGKYFDPETNDTLFGSLCSYAKSLPKLDYLVQTVERAKKTIKRYFPSLYKEFPYVVSDVLCPSENAEHKINDKGYHELTLYTSSFPGQDIENAKVSNVFESGYAFQRKIADLMHMVHEYSHGIYDLLTSLKEELSRTKRRIGKESQDNTADQSFMEGFCVFVEQSILEYMIKDANKLSLGEREISDLEKWRELRLKDNEANESTKDCYLTFKKKYTEEGAEGLLGFINKIDRIKYKGILTNSTEYTELFRDT